MFLSLFFATAITLPAMAGEPAENEAPASVAAEAEGYCLVLKIEGIRNDEGLMRIAVFGNAEDFEQSRDPAVDVSLQADSTGISHRLCGLSPGRWGLAVFHDEDVDMELDTFFGIPREGFGFSRNPRIIKGKPGFDDVGFEIGTAAGEYPQTIQMNYLL